MIKKGFPYIVEDADEESVKVNVMHRVVRTRFFLPDRKGNIVWYEYTYIITLIPERQRATSRHYQVEPKICEEVQKQEDDE